MPSQVPPPSPTLEPLPNPHSFQVASHNKKRITKVDALKTLDILETHIHNGTVNLSDVYDILIDVSSNLLGKGGDPDIVLFLRDIPINKLIINIKKIWEQKYEIEDSVKMGSKLFQFVSSLQNDSDTESDL